MFHKKKQEDEFEMVNLRTVYGVYEREALTGLLDENNIHCVRRSPAYTG